MDGRSRPADWHTAVYSRVQHPERLVRDMRMKLLNAPSANYSCLRNAPIARSTP